MMGIKKTILIEFYVIIEIYFEKNETVKSKRNVFPTRMFEDTFRLINDQTSCELESINTFPIFFVLHPTEMKNRSNPQLSCQDQKLACFICQKKFTR